MWVLTGLNRRFSACKEILFNDVDKVFHHDKIKGNIVCEK